MKMYKLTQTETHTYKGESPEEILELFNEGVLDCAESITVTVEEITKNFSGAVSQLEPDEAKIQICEACGLTLGEGGYHRNDEVTLTFSTLKHAQNQAIVQGIKYAMDYLEDINYHDGANAVSEFLTMLTEPSFGGVPTWQAKFMNTHALYSTECEGSN